MVFVRGEIKNFRKIPHLVIDAQGNTIVITGANGVGKSSVFETLMVALKGKKLLKPDAISDGADESNFTWEFATEAGSSQKYVVDVTVKPDRFELDIKMFNAMFPKGMKLNSPQEFLDRIAPREFIDPKAFADSDGTKRVAMLYKLMPHLQSAVDALHKKYEAEQLKRSQVNIDKNRISNELCTLLGVTKAAGETIEQAFARGAAAMFPADIKDVEEDAADLMAELNEAREHNLGLAGIDTNITNIGRDITVTSEMIDATLGNINRWKQQIAEAEQQAKELTERLNQYNGTLVDLEAKKAAFQQRDEKAIEARISSINTTNALIRKNVRCKELLAQIEAKSTEYSEGLEAMRKVEEEKLQVYRDAAMPVEGLSVGEDDLMYPDPSTGTSVPFSRLSTGQQLRAAVQILAPFLPKKEDGLRGMIIDRAECLDKENYEAIVEASEAHDVQLIMLKTTWEAQGLQVIVEERK